MLVILINEIFRDALHLLFVSISFLREYIVIQNAKNSLWVMFSATARLKKLIKLFSLKMDQDSKQFLITEKVSNIIEHYGCNLV